MKKYGKSFIKNIEKKTKDKALLNDKEEIEKANGIFKELDNKKLYYDEFFNQIHKTKHQLLTKLKKVKYENNYLNINFINSCLFRMYVKGK